MLKVVVIVVVVGAALVVLAGQLGMLRGQPPGNLGVRDGRFAALSKTPNCVSSQAGLWPGHPQQAYAQIDPLALRGTGPQTLARLKTVVQTMPGAQVVSAEGDYLYATFTTRWMKFTDDVEFWFDPSAQVVQVRSASRLGQKDFGANRARIETIRAALAAGA